MVSYLIVSKVNIANVDRVSLQRLTQHNQCLVVNSIGEVVFVVTLNDKVDCIVLIVGLFQVGAESFVSFDVSLLTILAILIENFRFGELGVLDLLIVVAFFHFLLLLLIFKLFLFLH
jgi:hypothetical protein